MNLDCRPTDWPCLSRSRPDRVKLKFGPRFHHDWIKLSRRVIDSRITSVFLNRPVGVSVPLHSYIVEFRMQGGEPTKLEVEQHIDTIEVAIGHDVPLLVSPDGKEAVIDHKDPRINVVAISSARNAADEERFRTQLKP